MKNADTGNDISSKIKEIRKQQSMTQKESPKPYEPIKKVSKK